MLFLNDLHGALLAQALAPISLTQTATQTYVDMITGDGNVNGIVDCGALSGTSLSVQVEESTLTNSAFTAVSGAVVTVTAGGQIALIGPFQRSKRYLRTVCTFSGTTFVVGVTLTEQLKKL